MDYALWREITVSVGALLGLLGFFRSLEQKKEQSFLQTIRELSNHSSAMLRAVAASQLPNHFLYKSYGFLKRPFKHQAFVMAQHGLKEKDELPFVRQELVNSFQKMLKNSIRKEYPRANLVQANLAELILHDFDFSRIDLTDAKLGKCDLGNADFEEARLWKATFINSKLTNCNLNNAMIWDADFSFSNLTNARLLTNHVNDNTKFQGATFKNTKISNKIAELCKLHKMKGVIVEEIPESEENHIDEEHE